MIWEQRYTKRKNEHENASFISSNFNDTNNREHRDTHRKNYTEQCCFYLSSNFFDTKQTCCFDH